MAPLVTKIIVLILFWVLTALAAFLPALMRKLAGGDKPENRARVQHLLVSMNYVAGGVFIATILLHLIPEVHQDMHTALKDCGLTIEYPIPELIIGMGLLLFVLIEQTVLACQGEKVSDNSERTVLTKDSNPEVHDKLVDDHSHSDSLLQTTSMVRSYALIIALSLHSIFEGMVVGFQKSSALVWELFIAIIIHKVLVAFGLGSRLLTARHLLSPWHYAGMILIFVSMTPLGGVIGTAMASQQGKSPAMNLVQSILVGLATGSFMFVTFFEIVRFDGGHKVNLVMCFLVVVGFACLALVMTIHSDHDHDSETGNTSVTGPMTGH